MNHHAMVNAVFGEIRQCCQHLLQAYDRINTANASKKDKADFAASIDADIQHRLISKLKSMYPRHHFVAEEPSNDTTQALPDHPNVWVIDPIDGSNNYMHNIPLFSISICYYYQGEKTVAWVYSPLTDELFSAIKDKGAVLNQHRINTSRCQKLSDAVLGMEGKATHMPSIADKVRSTRKLGSTSLTLCYAASGRFDIASCQSPHLWDVAAGILIAQEAGAMCINADNTPYQDGDSELYVASKTLLDQLQ